MFSLSVGRLVCGSPLITYQCAIITSCVLLPYAIWLHFSQLTKATLSTDVANMGSLAQLRVWDTEKQRQCRRDDVRPTERGNAKSKQLLVGSSWVDRNVWGPGCSFRYEILDLFYCTHNLLWKKMSVGVGGWGVYTELVHSVNPTFPYFFFCSASCYILKFFITSGNHIPGSRFYSDLGYLGRFHLHPPARTQV